MPVSWLAVTRAASLGCLCTPEQRPLLVAPRLEHLGVAPLVLRGDLCGLDDGNSEPICCCTRDVNPVGRRTEHRPLLRPASLEYWCTLDQFPLLVTQTFQRPYVDTSVIHSDLCGLIDGNSAPICCLTRDVNPIGRRTEHFPRCCRTSTTNHTGCRPTSLQWPTLEVAKEVECGVRTWNA